MPLPPTLQGLFFNHLKQCGATIPEASCGLQLKPNQPHYFPFNMFFKALRPQVVAMVMPLVSC